MSDNSLTRRAFGSSALGMALGACATASGSGEATRTGATFGAVAVGQQAPALSFRGLDRSTVNLRSLRGQVVLLDIWASWCEPCKLELPALDDIAARLRDRKVTVVAVSIDQEEANMRRFLATRRNWNVRFFHDPSGQVAERLAPPKMPTSYAIDRQGVVRMVNTGFQPDDAGRIEQELRRLST